uniref:Uncharacterized protein n=1 Tax=Colletotrichum fructicola (strain Nara gc5) TaxID=1213859 RepID=L2GIX1_COLFN
MATPPTDVALISPSKYTSSPPASASAPPIDWLLRTWTVTHSTLAMWRDARNVRITYAALPAKPDGTARIDDLVEYESNKSTPSTGVKSVKGVDTAVAVLCWEVLGWGEKKTAAGETERWAVTWFAPTVFTKEGVDIYCDRKEGLSEGTYKEIMAGLKGLEAKEVAEMVEKDMKPVEILLPWKEA